MKKLNANKHEDKVDTIKLLAELQKESASFDVTILGLQNKFNDL
jgi:hypothetical protein